MVRMWVTRQMGGSRFANPNLWFGTHVAREKEKPVEESTGFGFLAERAGFEPALGFHLNTLSRRAT
ncbi:protein of unknown function [Sterolibacterium denitrificans]|uniref:Uncharacterized protein n=1 Tax=Sterolibacterium denitrificans TaxID=157592 RepID=A0A7Z7MVV5_9PROT|nr:protein of unknown function [Sterolibacterium denitrificans]